MEIYDRQVKLLLEVLPLVAEEECFALHGGTAINLFVRNMPRLSVDIDLTYLPIQPREETLKNIALSLDRLKQKIQEILNISALHQIGACKLIVSSRLAQIKIEVNPVSRGVISSVKKLVLCEKAQVQFDTFSAVNVVPISQLYGGKICAALSRQHPRDLFDVKYLLSQGAIDSEVKRGFIYCLLSSPSPMHEVIQPNLHDLSKVMETQFNGMTFEEFSYGDYEKIRIKLLDAVSKSLNYEDKLFLLSIKGLNPDWSIYNFSKFPSIQWKIKNLETLRSTDQRKFQRQYDELRCKLAL